LDVISIVAKSTKFEQEHYISNQLFLIQIIKKLTSRVQYT